MTERFEMEWEGRKYFLSPQGFYDSRTFLKPPEAIHQRLKAVYARELEIAFQTERDVPLLLKHSRLAKDLGFLDLAEKITEQALSADLKTVLRLPGSLPSSGPRVNPGEHSKLRAAFLRAIRLTLYLPPGPRRSAILAGGPRQTRLSGAPWLG
jgi:hypothetical protein